MMKGERKEVLHGQMKECEDVEKRLGKKVMEVIRRAVIKDAHREKMPPSSREQIAHGSMIAHSEPQMVGK